MSKPDDWAFSFEEADHLTRIHLKLALEDVGFAVEEADDTIAIAGGGRLPTASSSHSPSPFRGLAAPSLSHLERDEPPQAAKGEGERDEPGDPTPARRSPTTSSPR